MSGKGVRQRRISPFSIRLTQVERSRLVALAGGQPLAAYVKTVLFPDGCPEPRPAAPRAVHADRRALAGLLAALGASRLASNLNQLAKAVHIGCLPVTPDTEAELVRACSEISAMRQTLMTALGIRSGEKRRSLTDAFSDSAGAAP